MTNLAIDIGNSRLKMGVFKDKKLIFKEEQEPLKGEASLEKILDLHIFQNILLATTGNSDHVVTLLKKKGLSYEILSYVTAIPFKNEYQTPETLGVDRIALVAAAVKHYPGQDVLVIDTGTCMTFDFKTMNETYLGGSISPGLTMRFKALHHFTAKLPLLHAGKIPEYIGKNTNEALQSGVIQGILNEIDGIIYWYKERYPQLTVILTGGDALFLSKSLKNGIFAHSNFLLEGLDYIMVFNTIQ